MQLIISRSPEQAQEFAGKMIGAKLITKQTGAGGRLCNAVSLDESHQNVVLARLNCISFFSRSCLLNEEILHTSTMLLC